MYILLSLSVLALKVVGQYIQDKPTSIINGSPANINDYPYYVFISRENELHCGGAIIARNIILTAAHCLTDRNLKVYTSMTQQSDKSDMNMYEVKDMLVHPKYTETSAYDIGLIKLKTNIQLTDKAQIVNIATEKPAIGTELAVVGFGYEECVNGFLWFDCLNFPSEHLNYASLKIMQYGHDDGIIFTMGEGKNTCYGDSGSPLVYDEEVVAVVSSGQTRECTGYDEQASVARVSDWIMDYVKQNTI